MASEKSQISSVSVGLSAGNGSRARASESALQKKNLEKWRVLLCLDFGFQSAKPELLSSALWSEFFATNPIALQGSVQDPFLDVPFFFEHQVRLESDFSTRAIIASIPKARELQELIEGLKEGSVPWSDPILLQVMKAYGAAQEVLDVLSKCRRPDPDVPVMPSSNRVDSILDMMETGDEGASETLDAGSETLSVSDKEKVWAFLDACCQTYADTVLQKEFVWKRHAQFVAVKGLCKAIGRSSGLELFVYSASGTAHLDSVSEAVRLCESSGTPPDIVFWDYPCDFTSAYVNALKHAAISCQASHALLLAPLSPSDPLVAKSGELDSIDSVFQLPDYLPLRSLQNEDSMRTVCLCAPHMKINPLPSHAISACWLLLYSFIDSLLLEKMPGVDKGGAGELPEKMFGTSPEFIPRVRLSFAKEASSRGLCFLTDSVTGELPVAIAQSEVGSTFGTLGQNLLANRALRLTTLSLASAQGMDIKETCILLYKFLNENFQAFGILDENEGVEITSEDDGGIAVTINTNVVIGSEKVSVRFRI